MHGMINRAIEDFVRDAYGEAAWQAVAAAAGIDAHGFRLLQDYPDDLTRALLAGAGAPMGKSAVDVAEDLGAWLAAQSGLRRLLRFAGSDFSTFVLSLAELPGRARMVVPGLILPPVQVETDGEAYRIRTDGSDPLWLHALAGMLQAMADDYGVLAVLALDGDGLRLSVPLAGYTQGRPFSISDPAVGAA
ncbi:heme NO-binding domain-containing protein [Paracoccus luteus]|uniref:heme NO-binding domain-containing protein n=1 Tax=Paracoccus luteus TaxID=2508543 RepID=UPI00106F37B7|nr:heme NO-binding domain-containing protein [Paracoccus luteus]